MSPDDQSRPSHVVGQATTSTDSAAPMNRYQLESIRAIAAQKIATALQDFAAQLPQGKLYVQEALNAAGTILDNLERHTHQYDEALALEPDQEENPDLAQHRAATAGVEESDEIKDFDMS